MLSVSTILLSVFVANVQLLYFQTNAEPCVCTTTTMLSITTTPETYTKTTAITTTNSTKPTTTAPSNVTKHTITRTNVTKPTITLTHVTKVTTTEPTNVTKPTSTAPTNVTKPTNTPTDVTKATISPTNVTKPTTTAPTNVTKPTITPTNATKPNITPTDVTIPTITPTNVTKATTTPTNVSKPTTTAPTNATKPTITPTNATKPTITSTNVTKPTITPTIVTKPATITLTNETKPIIFTYYNVTKSTTVALTSKKSPTTTFHTTVTPLTTSAHTTATKPTTSPTGIKESINTTSTYVTKPAATTPTDVTKPPTTASVDVTRPITTAPTIITKPTTTASTSITKPTTSTNVIKSTPSTPVNVTKPSTSSITTYISVKSRKKRNVVKNGFFGPDGSCICTSPNATNKENKSTLLEGNTVLSIESAPVKVPLVVSIPKKFDPYLLDKTSKVFKEYKKEFQTKLVDVYKTVKNFLRVDILGFRKGSTECDYAVVLKPGSVIAKSSDVYVDLQNKTSQLNHTTILNYNVTSYNSSIESEFSTLYKDNPCYAFDCGKGYTCWDATSSFVTCKHICSTQNKCQNGGECLLDDRHDVPLCRDKKTDYFKSVSMEDLSYDRGNNSQLTDGFLQRPKIHATDNLYHSEIPATKVVQGREHHVMKDDSGEETYIYSPSDYIHPVSRSRAGSSYSNHSSATPVYYDIDTESKFEIKRPNIRHGYMNNSWVRNQAFY